jgi:hypothetical protein
LEFMGYFCHIEFFLGYFMFFSLVLKRKLTDFW